MTPNKLSWKSIKAQVMGHKKELIAAHVIAILAALVSVPIPLMMPLLVDEVLLAQPGKAVAFMNGVLPESAHNAVGYILTILGLVICMRLGNLVLSVWQSRQFTLIGKDISLGIRQQLLTHLPQVQLKEYETQGSAGISSRCVTDVETLDKFISQTLSRFLIGVLTIIGTAIVLLWIDVTLGLIILLLNPLVIYFSRSFGKHVKHLKKEENHAFEAFQAALVETLDAISQLKATRKEQSYFATVSQAARTLKNRSVDSQWKTEAVNRLSFAVFLIGFEVFRAIAMLMVVFSDLTVGQIFAVFGYLWFMMGPVQELLNIQYAFYGAQAALTRLNQVFAFEREPAFVAQHNPFLDNHGNKQQVAVTLQQIQFAYGEQTVLDGVDLTIAKGQKTAVVAVSGGGKSTLVQLLLGLYQKHSGNILINDVPIEQVGYDKVRENVITVLQQPILFNASVRDNLAMGATCSDDTLWQALSVAELKETVEGMPQGLDTLVGKNGVRLSGGQRQRLAIARMVVSDPAMVILDEATSALDAETEAKVHSNLASFLANRTTLIIAHRLSAIKEADVIYVLDEGKVHQSGAHEALLAEKGLYHTLFAQQT